METCRCQQPNTNLYNCNITYKNIKECSITIGIVLTNFALQASQDWKCIRKWGNERYVCQLLLHLMIFWSPTIRPISFVEIEYVKKWRAVRCSFGNYTRYISHNSEQNSNAYARFVNDIDIEDIPAILIVIGVDLVHQDLAWNYLM